MRRPFLYPTGMGKPARKKPRRVEDGVQSKYLAALLPLLREDVRVYAIPNGGFRLKTEAIRLKATGVRGGITDLVFLAPRGKCAWQETKTEERGSRLSDEQIGFREFCIRSGHLWATFKTVEEGLAQVRAWGFLKEGC